MTNFIDNGNNNGTSAGSMRQDNRMDTGVMMKGLEMHKHLDPLLLLQCMFFFFFFFFSLL